MHADKPLPTNTTLYLSNSRSGNESQTACFLRIIGNHNVPNLKNSDFLILHHILLTVNPLAFFKQAYCNAHIDPHFPLSHYSLL